MIRPIAVSALVLLSACDGPRPSEPPPPPGVVLPTAPAALPLALPAQPRLIREERVSATTVSPDGRMTTGTSTSTSVSVDPAAFLTALAGAGAGAVAGAPPAPPNRAADFLGEWSVSNVQNRACRFTLHPPIGTGAGFAQNMGCTGPQMVAISRWALRDGVLELANGFGGVQARLRVTAPNRMDGDGITMWR
jgi:hypothetical protein